MKFYTNVGFNQFKKLFLKKATISFFLFCSIGFPALAETNSVVINDTLGIDTLGKTSSVSFYRDSSKLFSNLLSPASTGLNFSMNADAKFFVDDYIKKNQTYYNNMKVWGKPYFDLYDKILASYGIPVQLKYLSVIESSLSSTAISWAGAVGPWQIMSGTAREHGLRTSYYSDDRLDYIKSTNAACKILKELYDTYGDWLLVVAAYNCGSSSVNRAIAKAHSKNFWDIQYYLPLETRNHVKKFIATHYFFEGNNNIETANKTSIDKNLAAGNTYLEMAANSTTVNIYGKYNSSIIANTLMMDVDMFNQLNPDLDKVLAKGDVYPLRIPADKLQLFQSKKMDMLKQSVEQLLNPPVTTTTATPGK